jgi:hypothetical protein
MGNGDKGKMRADRGFRRAMVNYFADGELIDWCKDKFGPLAAVLTKVERTTIGWGKLLPIEVVEADALLRIGFIDAVFDRAQTRSNFWVKPDFVLRSIQNRSKCIVFEHCGAWSNFYSKRFMYEANRLAFFEHQNNAWERVENIQVVAVLYTLKNENHSRRVVRTTPRMGNELFQFDYESFREEDFLPDVQEYLEQAVSREQVVAKFLEGFA